MELLCLFCQNEFLTAARGLDCAAFRACACRARIEEFHAHVAKSGESTLNCWFKHFDVNGDDKITFQEWTDGMQAMHYEGDYMQLWLRRALELAVTIQLNRSTKPRPPPFVVGLADGSESALPPRVPPRSPHCPQRGCAR